MENYFLIIIINLIIIRSIKNNLTFTKEREIQKEDNVQKTLNSQFESFKSNSKDKQINSITQEMQMMWREIEESFKKDQTLDDSLNERKAISQRSSPVNYFSFLKLNLII